MLSVQISGACVVLFLLWMHSDLVHAGANQSMPLLELRYC